MVERMRAVWRGALRAAHSMAASWFWATTLVSRVVSGCEQYTTGRVVRACTASTWGGDGGESHKHTRGVG